MLPFHFRLICNLDDGARTRAEANTLAADRTHSRETRTSSDTLEQVTVENHADCEERNNPLRDDGVTNERAPGGHEVLDSLAGVGVGSTESWGEGKSVHVDGSSNLDHKIDRLGALDGERRLLGQREMRKNRGNSGASDVDTGCGNSLRCSAKRMPLVTSVRSGGSESCAEVQNVQSKEGRDLHGGSVRANYSHTATSLRTRSSFSLAIGFSSASCNLPPSFRKEPLTPMAESVARWRKFFVVSVSVTLCLLLLRDRTPRTAVPFAVTAVMELDLERARVMSRTFLMRRT